MTQAAKKAHAYLAVTVAVGSAALYSGLSQWESTDPVRYACFFLIALLASGLKVSLPGITATMSVNFLFVLIGIVELSLAETLAMACATALFQLIWKARLRPRVEHVAFNLANTSIAVTATYWVYYSLLFDLLQGSVLLLLGAAATVYFLMNTVPVSAIVALTEGKEIGRIWRECYFWSFPYYLGGAAVAGLFYGLNHLIGWQASLLVLPVVFWIYRSYRMYLDRLEAEKKHVEEIASLHLRTIEALSLAIDAKDHSTHDHLRRVRVYATEIGRELGLDETELEALRAAALLHDIGKLAVPEHILSKPGRLTPEEFEKLKIHPIVGAEILDRVQFPYPVVPIVLAHHEKWDGTGYPYGLKGEQIPLGARILSVVDCLDALASHRQYRRALPLRDAMEVVVHAAGTSFDPRVVDILTRRHEELEQLAQAEPTGLAGLSTNLRIENGQAPATGFEQSLEASSGSNERFDFLTSIASARHEAQMLFELSQALGNSLSLDETLSVLGVRLKRLIPYETIAAFVRREDSLVPCFVNGEDFRLLSSLQVPWGGGLVGWVAQNRKPILNGNPSVEVGYATAPGSAGHLRSALAVPLEGANGIVGVLALYHTELDTFSRDHLRVLLAISSKISISIENAMKYSLAESSATTDYLTGLPNARSLFLHLDSELARCRREKGKLSVLVCDLDGFKQVNDRFGHLEGNRVLRLMASKLNEICREYDYVARMGGDEFVLVLPGMDSESIGKTIQRLNEGVTQLSEQLFGQSLLSLSVGHSFFPDDGKDAEQLLAVADRRMYIVKAEHHAVMPAAAPAAAPRTATFVC